MLFFNCDIFCYFQTGTLTEDGLEVWGAVPVKAINIDESELDSPISDFSQLNQRGHMAACLASCHSLTYINGQLIGDPLDIKMFEATHWVSI